MSTAEISPSTSLPSVPASVRAAQFLLVGPLGGFVMFGAFYFSLIARPSGYGVVDGVLAVIALVLGSWNIYAGLRLAGGGESIRRLALALAAGHLVFSVVKIVGYDEPEAVVIAAVDVLTLAALGSPIVRRHARGIGR